MQRVLILICVLYNTNAITRNIFFPKNCNELNYLPMPTNISCKAENPQIYQIANPCSIKYVLKLDQNSQTVPSHIAELIGHQQLSTFKCLKAHIIRMEEQQKIKPQLNFQYEVKVKITNYQLRSAFRTQQQSYQLHISEKKAQIIADFYVGFVRGLETFMQSIQCNVKCNSCYMIALPIHIQDKPLLRYRGLLIDTSRHYLGMNILKETVDAMMYNKMNVFHWHIIDEDSFPLQLESHPEIAEYGSFSFYQRYSTAAIKDFVRYAMVRGVRVIPEIDTPGHAASWGRAPQNNQIACSFNSSSHQGPLDVTMDKTYRVVKQVFQEIFNLFPDPYVHLGGDQVQLKCLKNKTQFIRLEGLPANSTNKDIQFQYRRKQKKMLRQLNQSKKFIYWMHNKVTQIGQDDVIHHWGNKELATLDKTHDFIISKSTFQFYIDMGTGGIRGNYYHNYSTWLDMYKINLGKEIQKFQNKEHVLGIQLTLWAQTNNIYTHHLKIWIRSSAMAERAWNSIEFDSNLNFFRRMLSHQKLMNRRGIPTAPATKKQCEVNPQLCI